MSVAEKREKENETGNIILYLSIIIKIELIIAYSHTFWIISQVHAHVSEIL